MKERLPEGWIERCAGLRPALWICVGEGVEREAVKASVLNSGRTLSTYGIQSPRDLVLKILSSAVQPGQPELVFLSDAARRDWLRVLFMSLRKEPEVLAALPQLLRLKRERPFIKRLDHALSQARLAFAHLEEARVLQERLETQGGRSRPLLDELWLLTLRYEAELKSRHQFDWPLALRAATEILMQSGWPNVLPRPEAIVWVSATAAEPLEARFWQEVERHVKVEKVGIADAAVAGVFPVRRFHTMDDAIESLCDAVNLETDIVLIPDEPEVRRSLTRTLRERGLWLLDPRDPTTARLSEDLKRQFAWLKAAATGFESADLAPWLTAEEWTARTDAGVTRGMAGLQNPTLLRFADVFLKTSRWRLKDLVQAYQSFQTGPELERFWEEFFSECEALGIAERRWPLRYWWERISERLRDLSPRPDPLRPRNGLRMYRLSQAAWELPTPVTERGHLFVVGATPAWFTGEDAGESGDLWFSARDREILSGEFGLEAPQDRARRGRSLLRDWMRRIPRVEFFDAEFDPSGRERESLAAALAATLGRESPEEMALEFPLTHEGSHPRWREVFGPPAWRRPEPIQLPQASERGVTSVSASTLDAYSRCGFKGLLSGRWRAEDLDEPELEIRATAKGQWLHRAAEILVQDIMAGRTPDIAAAMERAGDHEVQMGRIPSVRVQRLLDRQVRSVLETFVEKELEFRKQSGAELFVTEHDAEFERDVAGLKVKGRADRIDAHPDGLWVVDYKSGRDFPHGKVILEKGYALQLPFYAVAAAEKFSKPVIGAQYIGLNSEAQRIKGVFFSDWFGKEKGCLVNSRSKESLMTDSPDVIWARLELAIEKTVQAYAQGEFRAAPKVETDCDRCFAREACGILRSPATES